MFRRFDDPAVEREYVYQERLARIPATRFLLSIGVLTILSYVVVNPIFMPRDGILDYNLAAIAFIAILTASVATTFTDIYIRNEWIDFLVFTALLFAMAFIIEALRDQQSVTGFGRAGLPVVNLGLLTVFASICFVASTRAYAAWAGALILGYVVFLIGVDRPFAEKFYTFSNYATFFFFGGFVNWDIDRRARKTFAANLALEAERAKTEQLLFNVLPQEVATRLQDGEAVADAFSDVSVIFVDIVGFSKLAKVLSPGTLVKTLNAIFQRADNCADEIGIEKVKTIGDAYLAVAGGQASTDKGAEAAIDFSCLIIRSITELAEQSGLDVKVRIGIHTGPVIGGVVGLRRFAYDYWGDTMNVASRLESIAEPNCIAVSEATYYAARNAIAFSGPDLITLKGVGELKVYRVSTDIIFAR